jgi:hypothetical protein
VVIIFAVAAVGTVFFIASRAATPFVTAEPDAGTVKAPAAVVNDSAASGGKAVKFNTPQTAGCTVSDKLVNSCRPWLGAWVASYPQTASDTKSQVLYHEQQIGRQVDFVHYYHPAGSNSMSATEKYFYARAGTYLYVNWKPANSWAQAGGSDSSTNAGIDAMADSIKALGSKKILLTVFHEPENDVTSGASGCSTYKGSAGTPAQYRAMWQNVRNRFDAKGVNNVVWVMNYMGFSNWECMVDDLWPGNNLVDWVVWDPYANGSTSFSGMVNPFYSFLEQNSDSTHNYTSKPWGFGEYGTYKMTNANIQNFWTTAKASIDNNQFPRLKLLTIFDAPGGLGEHRVAYTEPSDGSNGTYDASLLAKYVQFAQDPRFTDAFYK